MPINILMPALSPTMEEGTLAKWLVAEGDTVSSGDIIAEIETDKATMEVEAVDEGTVAKILIAEGTEGVKVNSVIAMLADDGEDVSAAAVPPSGGSAATSPVNGGGKNRVGSDGLFHLWVTMSLPHKGGGSKRDGAPAEFGAIRIFVERLAHRRLPLFATFDSGADQATHRSARGARASSR